MMQMYLTKSFKQIKLKLFVKYIFLILLIRENCKSHNELTRYGFYS